MPNVVLALGPVVFRDFELPPEIRFGGKQRVAVHRLADGQRVIDCLGRDDADIRFSGVLSGPDATSRAQALDMLRSSGVLVPLTWDLFFYSVVVAEFAASYRNDTWIPYTLRCLVLRDEAASLMQATASLAQTVMDDLNAAADEAMVSDVDFGVVSSAVVAPGATVPGSAAFQTASQSLGSASSTLQMQILSAEQLLAGIDLSHAAADTAMDILADSAATAQQLARLTRAHGYVGHARANLTEGSGAS